MISNTEIIGFTAYDGKNNLLGSTEIKLVPIDTVYEDKTETPIIEVVPTESSTADLLKDTGNGNTNTLNDPVIPIDAMPNNDLNPWEDLLKRDPQTQDTIGFNIDDLLSPLDGNKSAEDLAAIIAPPPQTGETMNWNLIIGIAGIFFMSLLVITAVKWKKPS